MIAAPAETSASVAHRRSSGARPVLFDRPNWTADSPAGRLFSAADSAANPTAPLRDCLRTAIARAGTFAKALELLPTRELERAVVLLALTDALFATANGPGTLESRVDDLDRIAFAIARALRGEAGGRQERASRTASLSSRGAAVSPARRSTTCSTPTQHRAQAATRDPRGPGVASPPPRRGVCRGALRGRADPGGGRRPRRRSAASGSRSRRWRATSARAIARCPRASWRSRCSTARRRRSVPPSSASARSCVKLLLRGARAEGEVPLSFRRPVVFLRRSPSRSWASWRTARRSSPAELPRSANGPSAAPTGEPVSPPSPRLRRKSCRPRAGRDSHGGRGRARFREYRRHRRGQ